MGASTEHRGTKDLTPLLSGREQDISIRVRFALTAQVVVVEVELLQGNQVAQLPGDGICRGLG